jgi:hypothetical protein
LLKLTFRSIKTFSGAFHSTCNIDSVSKQAISWHCFAHHTGNDRTLTLIKSNQIKEKTNQCEFQYAISPIHLVGEEFENFQPQKANAGPSKQFVQHERVRTSEVQKLF